MALLFFLQPIVRGWERYQGRLALRLAGRSRARNARFGRAARQRRIARRSRVTGPNSRVERVDFVAASCAELDRRGWPNRSDIGWSEFDVEIYGNRWSHVQLITAAEDHPRGRQLIRCRLRARWSLQAKVAFWSLLGLEALVVGFFGGWQNWLWLWCCSRCRLFAYFLSRQKRNLQSLVVVFLDELAKELKLIKVPANDQA